jgi:hypothetical protein
MKSETGQVCILYIEIPCECWCVSISFNHVTKYLATRLTRFKGLCAQDNHRTKERYYAFVEV